MTFPDLKAVAAGREPTDLAIRTRSISAKLWATTGVVYGVCSARQIYVLAFGSNTVLGNLRLFDLNGELTLPAWYSATLLLAAAGLLAVHAAVARSRQRSARAWCALAAVFLYLSLDETIAIHELGMNLLPDTFTGFLRLRWVIIAGPILVIVGLAFVPFLRRLPRPYASRIVVAGLVYVGGAYGMEMVGGYVATTRGMGKAAYLAISIEEGMEMAGACLFISTLLSLLAREAPELRLRIE